MGKTKGSKGPIAWLRSPGRPHGFYGELNGTPRKGRSFLKGHSFRSPRWGGGRYPAGAAGVPRAGVYPRLRALPEPCRKTHLQRKALTHQPGFYSFSTRSARWAHRKQGKRTYLAVLRGRPRGPAAGEGAPTSHSPPGRSSHGPSLPPRRSTPRSQLCRKREKLPVQTQRPSSGAKALTSSPSEGAQSVPVARRPGVGLLRRGAGLPGDGLLYSCRSEPGSVLLGRASAFPRSRRAAETNTEPSRKTRWRQPLRSGQEPRGGRGAERRGRQAPRALRPPPSGGSGPRPGSAPCRSPFAAQPAPPPPRLKPRTSSPHPAPQGPSLPAPQPGVQLSPFPAPCPAFPAPPLAACAPPNRRPPLPLSLSGPLLRANGVAQTHGRCVPWPMGGLGGLGGRRGAGQSSVCPRSRLSSAKTPQRRSVRFSNCCFRHRTLGCLLCSIAGVTLTNTPTLTNMETGAQGAGMTKPQNMWPWPSGWLVDGWETDVVSWK